MCMRLINYAAIVLFVSVCACSSGGGSRPQVTVPAPAPAPAPTPAPKPVDYRTAEYERNAGLETIGAASAYEAGLTGAGLLVAVIDTGIDVANPEFVGRIDPRSADLVISSVVGAADARSPASLQDADGHGTSVAGILAAAKNDTGVHGVAFNATLLAYRADAKDDPGTLLGEAIYKGAVRASDFGAKVLNMSLGSNEPGVRDDFRALFDYTSAHDVVSAVAAGNDGAADPDESALAAIDPEARGTVIIVGAVNARGDIASFSNRAGAGAAFYLAAPGSSIRTTALGANGGTALFSGTSAATPFVSGAAALLRERWPQLTAAEVVDILLTSATDLGDPGVDAVYGHGLLSLSRALQPMGSATTASVSGTSLSLDAQPSSFAPAFGASVPDFGDFIFLDGYGRHFSAPINAFVYAQPGYGVDPVAAFRPYAAIATASERLAGGRALFRLETEDRALIDPALALRSGALDRLHGEQTREDKLSFAFSSLLSESLTVAVGAGFGAREFEALFAQAPTITTLSRDGFADAYLAQNGVVGAMRWRAQNGLEVDLLMAAGADDRADQPFQPAAFAFQSETYQQANLRAGVTFTLHDAAFRLETGVRRETDGILGARLGGLLGAGADAGTFYQTGRADVALAGGWRLTARAAIGITSLLNASAEGFLDDVDDLVTTQFALGAYKKGVLGRHDRLSVSVSQPLQIESGGFRLIVPEAFDVASRRLIYNDRFIALDEGAREVDFEAGYLFSAAGATMDVRVLHQIAAGESRSSSTMGLIRTQIDF